MRGWGRGRLLVFSGVLAAVINAGGVPAGAAALPTLSIDRPDRLVQWSGTNPDFTGQGYQSPLDSTCSPQTAGQTQTPAPCDLFTLHVDLNASDVPGGVKGAKSPVGGGITKLQPYPNLPGDGVLVTIKWPTDFDQWNLYVDDPSGVGTANCATNAQAPAAIACGSDVDSNAQSVLIPWPGAAGGSPVAHWLADYPVKVVPFLTSFAAGGIDKTYQGRAQLFTDPAQRTSGHTQLLPRIQTLAPTNFHVSDVPPIPSNPTGWRFTPQGTFANSCYADETAQFGSTRCLRFDNTIRNVGAGPLTLQFQYDPQALATAIQNETNIPAGECHMNQEILWTDSAATGTASMRDAGPCVFHVAHGHFHYQNMGFYKMFKLGPDGDPHAIAYPDPGQVSSAPIATSNKIGFCTIDVEYYSFGLPVTQQRPRTYSFPTCNIANGYYSPGEVMQAPSTQYIGAPEYMGISPGWGDIYTWDLPTQYIDISKVPDGTYEISSSSNPDGGMLTTDHLPPAAGAKGSNGVSLPASVETGVSCITLHTNADGTTAVKVLKEFPSQPNDAPLPSCGGVSAARSTDVASAPSPNQAVPLPNTAVGRTAWLALPPLVVLVLASGWRRRQRQGRD